MKQVRIQTESFEITKEEENGVTMKGLALPFGKESRNGVQYDADSVKDTAETLIGRPLLWNHNDGELPVGHITNVELKDEGLYYEANLDPNEEKLITKLKRGDIRNVSIGVEVDEEKFEDNVVFVTDFYELSVCSIPGFPQTNLTIEKLIEERGDKQMSDKKEADEDEVIKEEQEPQEEKQEETEDEEEQIETLTKEIQEMKERISNLEAKFEASKEPEEDEEEEDEDEEDEEEEEEKKEVKITPEELEAHSKQSIPNKENKEEDNVKKALKEVLCR